MMPSAEYEVPPPPGLSGNAVAAALKLMAARIRARTTSSLRSSSTGRYRLCPGLG
jgi:hypothetical protein